MSVIDDVYGPALSKRLFPVICSSRASNIIRQWLTIDEGKTFLNDVESSVEDIKIKRSLTFKFILTLI